MANYGYLTKLKPKQRVETFQPILEKAVLDLLGSRWVVALADFEDDGPTFLVTVPGTAEESWPAFSKMRPQHPQDIGWTCSIQDRGCTIAFRHGPIGEFARWAQGCIEEELSERLKSPLHYDAGPITYKAGQRREYRRGKTLREYLLRNFGGKPQDAAHEKWLEELARGIPKGFWP